MPSIYLVRHGQAGAGMGSYDVEESYDGLTDLGRTQARTVAESLAGRVGVGHGTPVFCGNLNRQQDTADAIAAALSADQPVADSCWKEFNADEVVVPWMKRNPETAKRLRAMMAERNGQADAGAAGAAGSAGAAGDTEATVREVLDGALGEWVDAAGYQDFRDTVLGGLSQVTSAARENGAAVVATSAGVIATCTAAVSGLPRQAVPPLVGRIFNASVTVLRVADAAGRHDGGGAGADLLSFNEYGHLDRPDARDELTLI